MTKKEHHNKFKNLYEKNYGQLPSERDVWSAPEYLIDAWLRQMKTVARVIKYNPDTEKYDDWSYQKLIRYSYELKKKAGLVK